MERMERRERGGREEGERRERNTKTDVFTDVPDLGVPMLALHAPQSQSFDPRNWYLI